MPVRVEEGREGVEVRSPRLGGAQILDAAVSDGLGHVRAGALRLLGQMKEGAIGLRGFGGHSAEEIREQGRRPCFSHSDAGGEAEAAGVHEEGEHALEAPAHDVAVGFGGLVRSLEELGVSQALAVDWPARREQLAEGSPFHHSLESSPSILASFAGTPRIWMVGRPFGIESASRQTCSGDSCSSALETANPP